MAKFNIRPASPQKDFTALAELLDKVWPQTITAENLHEWESRKPEGQIRLRYVVDEQEAGIIGYGLVYREASGAKERFLIDVIVNPNWRQQGIGLSAVGYFAPNNEMYNISTGVMPAYRGRKIAQALKALALRYAQAYGAETVITHNDSQNAPMLAINHKFGYQPKPGEYRMVKRVSQEDEGTGARHF